MGIDNSRITYNCSKEKCELQGIHQISYNNEYDSN